MIYERHCIGILAHKSRVAAARHTRLTRSTGPTSVQVQTQMRATHFARVLSHLAHRAQLANADTRICTSRHSSTALHLDFAGKHLEAHARQTPFAGWHADESRGQSPLTHCALQNYSTRGFQPAPALRHCARELVAAAPPARKLHAAAQLLSIHLDDERDEDGDTAQRIEYLEVRYRPATAGVPTAVGGAAHAAAALAAGMRVPPAVGLAATQRGQTARTDSADRQRGRKAWTQSVDAKRGHIA